MDTWTPDAVEEEAGHLDAVEVEASQLSALSNLNAGYLVGRHQVVVIDIQ